MCKVTVWRMRERYAQTVLTFRIAYVKLSHNKFNIYNHYTFASLVEACEHLGFHNAEKLNNSWICFLGGPEDDRLGRNM